MHRRSSTAAAGRWARHSAEVRMRKVVASGAACGAVRRRTEGATRRNAGEERSAARRELRARVVQRAVEKRVVAAAKQPWRARVSSRRWCWPVASGGATTWLLALIFPSLPLCREGEGKAAQQQLQHKTIAADGAELVFNCNHQPTT